MVKSLCAEFGDIMTDGKVDRKKLGNIVFNDKSKLERLNELVHPAVIDRCVSLSTLLSVLDAPQLFEAGAQDKCFKTIAVLADEKTRLNVIISAKKRQKAGFPLNLARIISKPIATL